MPQVICTTALDDEDETEGEQQLGDVAVTVHAAQPQTSIAAPSRPHRIGAMISAGKKPIIPADLKAR